MTVKYTRKQYLAGKIDHQTYYGQFAFALISTVVARFGKRLLVSTDPYFNDIPLRQWDDTAGSLPGSVLRQIAEANGTGGVSLSDKVCALKAAARVYVENHKGG